MFKASFSPQLCVISIFFIGFFYPLHEASIFPFKFLLVLLGLLKTNIRLLHDLQKGGSKLVSTATKRHNKIVIQQGQLHTLILDWKAVFIILAYELSLSLSRSAGSKTAWATAKASQECWHDLLWWWGSHPNQQAQEPRPEEREIGCLIFSYLHQG